MGILSILHSILSFILSFLSDLWALAFSIIHEISPLRFKSVNFSYDNGSLKLTIKKLSLHLLQSKQSLIEVGSFSICLDVKLTIISFVPFVSISHNPYEQHLSQRNLIITHIKLDSVVITLRKSSYDLMGIVNIWRLFNAKTAVDDGVAFERYIQSQVMNHLLPTMPTQHYIHTIQGSMSDKAIKGISESAIKHPAPTSWFNCVVQEFVITRLTIQFFHCSTGAELTTYPTKASCSSRISTYTASSPPTTSAPELILQASKLIIIPSELSPVCAVASQPRECPSMHMRANKGCPKKKGQWRHPHTCTSGNKLRLHMHLPSILRLISHTRHQCHKHKQVVSTPPCPRPRPHPSVAAGPGLPLSETIWRLTALVFKRLFDREPGKVMRLLSLISVQRGLK